MSDTQTSEDLYGISPQPAPTCPMIDEIIRQLDDAEAHIRGYQKCEDPAELREMIELVERELFSWDTPKSTLEKIREHVESIRAWGEEWKQACLALSEERTK